MKNWIKIILIWKIVCINIINDINLSDDILLNISNLSLFYYLVLFFRSNDYLCTPNNFGTVAQSVEQWTENPCVAGSIPAHTTKNVASLERRFCF